jgi:hypothetical protein
LQLFKESCESLLCVFDVGLELGVQEACVVENELSRKDFIAHVQKITQVRLLDILFAAVVVAVLDVLHKPLMDGVALTPLEHSHALDDRMRMPIRIVTQLQDVTRSITMPLSDQVHVEAHD